MCSNSKVTCIRANNYNLTRPRFKSKTPNNKLNQNNLFIQTSYNTDKNYKTFKLNKYRELSNQLDNLYSKQDNLLVHSFVKTLKKLNGDWSRNGLQRVIRLNSECSNKYISLRSANIRADIPMSEAFKDPYSKYYSFFLFSS